MSKRFRKWKKEIKLAELENAEISIKTTNRILRQEIHHAEKLDKALKKIPFIKGMVTYCKQWRVKNERLLRSLL